MILVVRGPEPQALVHARAKHLPALQKLVVDLGRDPSSKEITGYGPTEVRQALYNAQHMKCCYCEKDIEDKREDVEHYRPKAEANRSPGSALRHGYWWLAHTWENLLYSCPQCNEHPAKGIQFPLDQGSTPLVGGMLPPGQERPLLIDPAAESGVKHIQFCLQKRGNRDVWIPEPRNNSMNGYWTIKVCWLKRDALLKLYGDHVQNNVRPVVEKVRAVLKCKNEREIYEAVGWAQRKLLRSKQRFVGLSYDALVHFIPGASLAPLGPWPMPT